MWQIIQETRKGKESRRHYLSGILTLKFWRLFVLGVLFRWGLGMIFALVFVADVFDCGPCLGGAGLVFFVVDNVGWVGLWVCI